MNYAAIEAGGTKFVCAIGNELGEILIRETFPTTTPQETMKLVVDFFKQHEFEKMGVGCFGPIDPNINSDTYGYITTTPKVLWQHFNIIGYLKEHFNVPIAFDTDVNGAALGEIKFGAAKGLDSCVYMTIGTGIGAGAVVSGNMINGMLHPEMGHIKVRRHQDDDFKGVCSFHNDCFEGLASGPAIEKRWSMKGQDIPSNHKAWDLEAYYIAQGIINFILILSPEKVILGGGVSKQKQLYPLIHKYVLEGLNGYIKTEQMNNIEDYIVYAELGDNAGIIGALALAQQAS